MNDPFADRACRVCGCTEDRACIKPDGEPCGWALTGVLCDAPGCLLVETLPGLELHDARIVAGVALERIRQVGEEGFNTTHDDAHDRGEIAQAAACYAMAAGARIALEAKYRHDPVALASLAAKPHASTPPPPAWPWEYGWWKPKDPRRDLERAAALAVAAIAAFDRRAATLTSEAAE